MLLYVLKCLGLMVLGIASMTAIIRIAFSNGISKFCEKYKTSNCAWKYASENQTNKITNK